MMKTVMNYLSQSSTYKGFFTLLAAFGVTMSGGMITELHSYCWNMNAYIKEQISNAQ